MTTIVSFDLDGTIVNSIFGDMVWNVGIPEEYAKHHGLPFHEAKEYITKEYETIGDENILWYTIDYWLKRFHIPLTSDALLERYVDYIELLPDARKVLEGLHKNYTLIIASNAARVFVEKEILHTGIGHYFTHIISATTDYNLVKKQETFYRTLCQQLRIQPHQIIHVGDHPVYDFYVPSHLGIESYYIRRDGRDSALPFHMNPELLEQYTLRSLTELLDRL